MPPEPKPFKIQVPDAVLDDLRYRLSHSRWPDAVADSGWRYGVALDYLQSLAAYWRDEYRWRDAEAMLNRFDQYTLPIDGIHLHFIHQRGAGPDPKPLLLMHGWPTSLVDFYKIIPMLTDPARFGGDPRDAFTVVAPSLPGHGFSFEPNQPRFGIVEIADTLAKLMRTLGYERFAAQGADWGAFISTRLAYAHAERLIGIFISLLAIPRTLPSGPLTADEQAFAEQLAHWLKEEIGYSMQMGTKPQTLAYALTDSPIGLAAWIIEKYRTWSDCDGDVDAYFGRDTLLTNVMMYWVTGAINSTFWPYYARHHGPWIVPEGAQLKVPVGYAEFPKEILNPPRSLAERYYGNIQRWTRMPRGGHFPALEAPDALVRECRELFRTLD
jgi:pimeloyl-ACP methyl ester carboxylesterase